MKPCFRYSLALSLLLVAAAALAGPPSLTWRGDVTTANNMVDGMASAWHKKGHPDMTLQPFNTVSGIDAVAKGSADIAGSVRGRAPRRANEKALVFTPVAWDALVIITNAHNPVDNLTLKQLHDIYYGKLTSWSKLGGKSRPINVYAVASPTDGIEFSLRRLLFGRGNQPVAAPRLYLNVNKLERAVELDPESLGVTTLSNVHGNKKVKMLSIDNKQPSVANVADGSYPLYTPLYLVTRPPSKPADESVADTDAGTDADTATTAGTAPDDSARDEQIAQFIQFAQSPDVADILHDHQLVPYANAEALAGLDDKRIAAIAQETGRHVYHHGAPTSAPGATYASRSGVAPTSERTQAARQQMLAKREEDKAAKVRADAEEVARRDLASTDSGTAGATAKVTWYTVVSGDTLSKIAHKQSVSVTQLRAWNDIKGNLIKVGQKIAIHDD